MLKLGVRRFTGPIEIRIDATGKISKKNIKQITFNFGYDGVVFLVRYLFIAATKKIQLEGKKIF